MNILAVDPGGTTGLAWWLDGEFGYEMLAAGDDRRWLAQLLLGAFSPFPYESDVPSFKPDLVAYESFRLGNMAGKTTQGAETTLATIGVLEFLCNAAGVPYETQAPSDVSTFDAMYVKTNHKFPGIPSKPDHARSAARHLLLALHRWRQIS